MKVGWIHNNGSAPNTAGVFMWQLMEAVRRLSIDVTSIHLDGLSNPGMWRAAQRRSRDMSEGCDLVHAQFGAMVGMIASRLPQPKLMTLRGSDLYVVPFSIDRKSHLHTLSARALTLMAARRYDRVIVCSEHMNATLRTSLAQPPITTIPDGIDLELFKPVARQTARERLGQGSDERPWVLFSSVHEGNKLKRKPLAEAAIAHARRRIPNLTTKYMHGYRHDEVPTIINAVDAVLLTSTHEGWPNIIKEGLACNVPFVATDVSDLRQMAAAAPNCFVAEPDPAALGDALVRCLETPRATTLRDLIAGMDMNATARRIATEYELVAAQSSLTRT